MRRWLAAATISAALAGSLIPARAGHAGVCEGLITQPTNPVLSGGAYPASFRSDGGCSSYAFADQGYMARGQWTIRIVRERRVYTYSSATSPQCRRTLIRPGDSVKVTVTSGWLYVFYDDDFDDCPI